MRCVELKEDPLDPLPARLRLDQPLVLDASPSKEPCFSAPIEASPAISRSSGGLKKFFRIIQHNPKESIDGRE
jgi:hypothetical protein